MNLVVILLSLLAIVILTAGTALFVAAEFSFTTLERSTVEANARAGRRRDRWVRRAHHTLSFQLSGAQLGISITTLITGYLTEPLVAELPHPTMDALGVPDRVTNAVIAFLTLLVVTSLSMIFGELVPKNLAVARPLPTARAVAGMQLLFSWFMTWPIRVTNGVANWVLRKLGVEPAQELRSARSAQELVSLVRNSARSGSLDPATAALLDRSLQFGDLTAEELMTPRSKIVALQVDNTVRTWWKLPLRADSHGSRSSMVTSTRRSASCTSNRFSECRPPSVSSRWSPPSRSRSRRCPPRWTATR
jgi:CBS domain containing-hemolysin-like protein